MTQLVDEETIAKNCDRILERVSPSQVETFRMCPRRWYNDSARGLREPLLPGSAAERGVDIAAEVEHYGKTGTVRPDAKFKGMVEAVLPHLSPFSPTVSVEEWVEADTAPGLPKIRGRYDWFDCSQRVWVEGHPRAPLLPDVKSRSDFRYAKTPVELADDVQMNTYGTALARRDGYDYITLRHAYTRTSGKPKGMEVNVTVSREDLEIRFAKTVEDIRQMAHWAELRPSTADPLPPNTEACGKFRPHGCPHRALCGFDAAQRTPFQGLKETKMPNGVPPIQSDLMKRLAERTAQQKTGAPASGPQVVLQTVKSAQEPSTRVFPVEVNAALKDIMDGNLKLDGTGQVFTRKDADAGWILRHPTASEKEAFRLSDEQHTKIDGQITNEEEGPAVLAPDAPPRTNPPVEARTETVEEAPKAKRAPRAKKAEPAQAEPAQAEPAQVEPAQVEPAQVESAPEAAVSITPFSGPVVYVNCVPTKGAHRGEGIHFEEWLAPICEELCQEKGVADYRQVSYTAKGDLAAKIRKYITTCPPVVLVSKLSPSADVFLESIIPYASQIIQGV